LVQRVYDTINIILGCEKWGIFRVIKHDILTNLCAGPNIEGIIIRDYVERKYNHVFSLVAIDINVWEYSFNKKVDFIIREASINDLKGISIISHGIDYVKGLDYKNLDKFLVDIKDDVIISNEHDMVKREKFKSFLPFEVNDNKYGVLCNYASFIRSVYRFVSHVDRTIFDIEDSCIDVKPSIFNYCCCYERVCDCAVKDVYHDLLFMESSFGKGIGYSDMVSDYILSHGNRCDDDCPASQLGKCVGKVRYLSDCSIHQHIKCLGFSGHFDSDRSLFLFLMSVFNHYNKIYGNNTNDNAGVSFARVLSPISMSRSLFEYSKYRNSQVIEKGVYNKKKKNNFNENVVVMKSSSNSFYAKNVIRKVKSMDNIDDVFF
jgi:hypothetical protein